MILRDLGKWGWGESRGAEVEASGAEVNDGAAAVEAGKIDEASECGECTLGAVESGAF